jgi:hypothetical protein
MATGIGRQLLRTHGLCFMCFTFMNSLSLQLVSRDFEHQVLRLYGAKRRTQCPNPESRNILPSRDAVWYGNCMHIWH